MESGAEPDTHVWVPSLFRGIIGFYRGPELVQLHMSRKYMESSLKKGMEELNKIYYNLLLEYYYDLESDPRIISITTLKLHIDKLRDILGWLQEHR